MNPNMVIYLSKTVYKKSDQMKQHPKLHKAIISIMLNTLIYLTGGQSPEFLYEKECEQFFSHIDEIRIDEHDLHTRNELITMRGLVDIRRGEREKEDYLALVTSKFPDPEDILKT